ncbi:MAG: methionyl-tRNA formyltransferase [Actinomycetota bacterium]
MRAVFMGTPEFAVPALDALSEVADVVGVVCQPDRPAGRGMQLTPPPVKVRALAKNLEVIQPSKVRDGSLAKWIRDKNADVALVVAYGRILPRDVLDAPKHGCLNVHASLLPKYRGAAPITWAIVRGEKETGVDLMAMEEGLDTGGVYAEKRTEIGPDETAGELGKRLSAIGGDLVRESLIATVEGKLPIRPQDHERATLAPILKKEDGQVDWSKPAQAIHDHVRGMSPWPGAFTRSNGKLLKVLRTRIVRDSIASPVARTPGAILIADKTGVLVSCGDGEAIAIVEAQPEGKRAMPASDLVHGRMLAAGAVLGA